MQSNICSSRFCYYNIQSDISPQERQKIKSIYCPNCQEFKYCSQRCLEQDKIEHSRTCKRFSDSQSSSTLSTNRKTLDDYEVITLPNKKTELGRGSYGSVKLVKEKRTGQKFAMKVISKKTIFQYCSVENLKREIKIQKKLQHSHITKLHHYFEDKENVYLILEYAENGSLFHFLRKKRRFPENEAFVYFFQTCLGIDYLHKKGVIHRDLKPENLLLDQEGNIKLCDFGWSAEAMSNQKRTTFCGTIDYMSPEMIKNEPHNHTLDIWCLGILLYEMLHGDAPFKGSNDHQKCTNIVRGQAIQYDSGVTSSCKDLIASILKQSPNERLSMRQIFSHPWMKSMEKVYNIKLEHYIYRESGSSNNNNSMVQDKQNISPHSVDVLQNQKGMVKSSIQGNYVKSNNELSQQQYSKQYEMSNMQYQKPNYQYQSNLSQSQQYGNKQISSQSQQYKYLDEENYRTRVSRVSQRNNLLESTDKRRNKPQEEEGFFNKMLSAFGCINRDNQTPKDKNMGSKQY